MQRGIGVPGWYSGVLVTHTYIVGRDGRSGRGLKQQVGDAALAHRPRPQYLSALALAGRTQPAHQALRVGQPCAQSRRVFLLPLPSVCGRCTSAHSARQLPPTAAAQRPRCSNAAAGGFLERKRLLVSTKTQYIRLITIQTSNNHPIKINLGHT